MSYHPFPIIPLQWTQKGVGPTNNLRGDRIGKWPQDKTIETTKKNCQDNLVVVGAVPGSSPRARENWSIEPPRGGEERAVY